MTDRKNIAIDGPSGAGKSTLARMAAAHFGLIYVDTGAIYRSVGLAARRAGISTKDEPGIAALLPGLDIRLCHDGGGVQRMLLAGEDISEAIRLPEISLSASEASALPVVRSFLLEMQRSLAREQDVVMDGRDIGTVVLPDAGLKIFLTADVAERARRRFRELSDKGVPTSLDEVLRDMQQRDQNDTNRAEAPLRAAEDAVRLDTTNLSLDESFMALRRLIEERFGL